MRDAAQWRKKAATLRENAKITRDAERERVYKVLAEDCDRIASRIERGAQAISVAAPGE